MEEGPPHEALLQENQAGWPGALLCAGQAGTLACKLGLWNKFEI